MNPFLFALLAALFTCAGSARAQDDAPSPSPYTLPNDVGLSSRETGHAANDPTSQARVLYLKGNAAFKNDDLIIARDYYKKSLEIRESFDTFCNLGRAEELSELLDGAYYHLGLCIKYYPPDEELAAAGKKYAELQQNVAKRLSAEQVVALDMKISAHELKVPDEQPSEVAAVAAPPAKLSVEKAQPSETKHNWVPAYVLGGVSVATLASSIVLRVVVGNKKDKLDEIRADILPDDCADSSNNDQCSDLESTNKTTRTLAMASDVTLIVAGAGAAATLGYVIYELVHTKRSTSTAQHTLRPNFGFVGNAGWMSLSGTF